MLINKTLRWISDYFPSFKSESLNWFRDLTNFDLADPLAVEIASSKIWFRSDINRLGIYLVNFLESSLINDKGEKFQQVLSRVVSEELTHDRMASWDFFVNDFVSLYFSLLDQHPPIIFFMPTILQTINRVLRKEMDIIDINDFNFERYERLFEEGIKVIQTRKNNFESVNYLAILHNLYESLNIIILETTNEKQADIIQKYFKIATYLTPALYNERPITTPNDFPTLYPTTKTINSPILDTIKSSIAKFDWIGRGYSITYTHANRINTLTTQPPPSLQTTQTSILTFLKLYKPTTTTTPPSTTIDDIFI